MVAPGGRGPVGPLLGNALVASLYLLTGAAGLGLAIAPGTVTAVWLPSGVALAALVLAGRALTPGIAVGAFAAELLVLAYADGSSWPAALGVATATALAVTAQAVLGAAVIARHAGGRRVLEAPRGVTILVVTVLAVAVLGATGSIGALAATDHVPPPGLVTAWLTSWLGHVGGMVLVTPLVLALADRSSAGVRAGDVALLALATLALAEIVVGGPVHRDLATIGSYLALPMVVYAAVRIGARGVMVVVALIYAELLGATLRGHGPFAAPGLDAALLQLDGYLIAVVATGLVLAASVRERDLAERALREARADLEGHVASRTASLVEANRALSAEIADRQRVEAALRQSEARLRTAIESLPFDFWVCDRDGRYLLQNSASIAHWGDQRGKTPEQIGLPPDVLARWQDNNARALAGEVVRGRTRYRHGDHEGVYEDLLAPIHVDGQVVGFLGLNQDVSERERLAEELVRAQRLEATGRLAGGIAHDFNNLLTVVIATAASLERRDRDRDPATADAARLILQAAQRAAELTRQLLAFAGKQRGQPVVRPVVELVDEVRGLLRPILPASIDVQIAHADPAAAISIDPTQFGQVLVNLAMNARDAMPAGGTLTIRTAAVELDARAAAAVRLGPGAYVRLEVHDTGAGIAPELLPRVFEPFFTTKPLGQGTGLGLASVHGIATQAGGAVDLRSEPGVGTTATVFIPRAAARARTAEPTPDPDARGRGETILLVEDQELVRRALAQVLAEAGFHVVEAGDGVEALRVALASAAAVDLVVTDVVMPRMGGATLARRLREAGLALPIIFMSGYMDTTADLPDGPRLAKPFDGDDLTAAVRAALDTQRAAPAAARG